MSQNTAPKRGGNNTHMPGEVFIQCNVVQVNLLPHIAGVSYSTKCKAIRREWDFVEFIPPWIAPDFPRQYEAFKDIKTELCDQGCWNG